MIRSSQFRCVLDTCVVHPIHIRDFLFWLADLDLYKPQWSRHIFKEWENLLKKKGLNEKQIQHRLQKANPAFPDAMVLKYEEHIDRLDGIKDINDRHVAAAVIKINANLIVTNNLKDFPNHYLDKFGLYAKSADSFIADLIDLHHKESVEAFRLMVLHKRNPPINEHEMLDILRNNGLKDTADYIHALI